MKALPKSLWAATATPALTYPRLDGDAAADCVIVGGGFTGLSTALHSAAGGLKVVLIEANEPGWGASGRNGGQVIPGLYCAGESAGGFNQHGLGRCTTQGFIAGTNAAREK